MGARKGVPGVSEFPKPKFMFENIEVDMCKAQFVVQLDCNLNYFCVFFRADVQV